MSEISDIYETFRRLQGEMKKAGIAVNNNLCPHFAMSRADLFNVVMLGCSICCLVQGKLTGFQDQETQDFRRDNGSCWREERLRRM